MTDDKSRFADGPSAGHHGLPLGPGGWLVRLVLAVAGAALVGVSLASGSGTAVSTGLGVLMLGLLVATVVSPGSPAVFALLTAAIGLRVAGGGTGPVGSGLASAALDGQLMALAALIPLVHQLSGIAVAVPVRARVQWPGLVPAAVRYAVAVVPVEVALVIW